MQQENELEKHKDECLARYKLKTKNRGQLETWLKKKGSQEQYWRDLFNDARMAGR